MPVPENFLLLLLQGELCNNCIKGGLCGDKETHGGGAHGSEKMLTSHLRKRFTKRFYDHNQMCNLENIIIKVV